MQVREPKKEILHFPNRNFNRESRSKDPSLHRLWAPSKVRNGVTIIHRFISTPIRHTHTHILFLSLSLFLPLSLSFSLVLPFSRSPFLPPPLSPFHLKLHIQNHTFKTVLRPTAIHLGYRPQSATPHRHHIHSHMAYRMVPPGACTACSNYYTIH